MYISWRLLWWLNFEWFIHYLPSTKPWGVDERGHTTVAKLQRTCIVGGRELSHRRKMSQSEVVNCEDSQLPDVKRRHLSLNWKTLVSFLFDSISLQILFCLWTHTCNPSKNCWSAMTLPLIRASSISATWISWRSYLAWVLQMSKPKPRNRFLVCNTSVLMVSKMWQTRLWFHTHMAILALAFRNPRLEFLEVLLDPVARRTLVLLLLRAAERTRRTSRTRKTIHPLPTSISLKWQTFFAWYWLTSC